MGRKIRQNCTSCGLVFKAEDKYVGKVVKCPQCKEPVSIVEGPGGSSSSILTAAPPPAKSGSPLPAAAPPPAKAQANPPGPRPASIPRPRAASAPAKPAPPSGVGIAVSAGDAAAGAASSVLARRKQSNNATLAMVLMGGAGVVTVAVLLGVAAFVSGTFNTPEVADADNDTAGDEATSNPTGASSNPTNDNSNSASDRHTPSAPREPETSSGFGKPGEGWNVFVLDISDRERGEVEVRIDGERKEVPPLGPVMYSLAAGQHRVTMTREGFDPIEHSFRLDENGRESYRPLWQREGSGAIASNFPKIGEDAPSSDFDDWLQDFEAAKRRAAEENKDILIAFNGTDWCVWCVRLMQEVLFQKDFRQRIEEEFVLVSIDSPRTRDAQAKVHDRRRNEAMIEKFAVSGYPTIVLTDSQGQAYAEGGYIEGGVDPFMEAIAEMKQDRDERDRLFAAVTASEGKQRIEAAEKAMEWLRDNGFFQHYGPTLENWLNMAQRDDPKNETGEYETFFELDWLSRIASVDRSNLTLLRPVFDRLEKFNKDPSFKDGDRGGRLNLIAASYFAMLDEPQAAQKFADAGVACKPDDADLASKLRRAARALANSDVLSSGTGFVIARGGYIMTNFHVVEEGKPFVRLPGREEPIPAKVIAKDERKDIALIQVADADVGKLPPLPFSSGRIGRGAPVGVFGYPLGDAVGSGLKLTTGIVSALADEANEGMMLLDCTVNPGNSGGPLCDTSGRVIGLVTAKSAVDFNVDSYGMARPATELEAFLKDNLPAYKPLDASNSELRWDQVDARVSASVLMIVMKE